MSEYFLMPKKVVTIESSLYIITRENVEDFNRCYCDQRTDSSLVTEFFFAVSKETKSVLLNTFCYSLYIQKSSSLVVYTAITLSEIRRFSFVKIK